MSKTLPSAVGIDLGEHASKAVLLHRKSGGKLALAAYSIRPIEAPIKTPDELAAHLRGLLKDLGGSSKFFSIAVSNRNAILRIINQPPTPVELLRIAVALNSMSLLNQDCKDYVLDCDLLDQPDPASSAPATGTAAEAQRLKQVRYLVGGVKRSRVSMLNESFLKAKAPPLNLQLAAVANLNAFAVSNPESFKVGSFMLVDVGHNETSVLMGLRGSLKLVRTIEYGGKNLLEAVTSGGAIDTGAAFTLLQQGDTGMNEVCRQSLSQLARELRSSIAFFEGQYEDTISGVMLSGAICRAELPLQVLSDEMEMPCQLWNPFDRCDINLSKPRKAELSQAYVQLGAASGAAMELLIPRD